MRRINQSKRLRWLARQAKPGVKEDLARGSRSPGSYRGGQAEGEAKTARLEVEWTSLLLELGATKNEESSIHSQEGRDKDVMEEEYQKAMEVIIAYGCGCCVFKHNICGDHPEVLEGLDSADPLPLEFFMNPGYPPAQAAAEATTTEAPPSKTTKEPMEIAAAEDQSGL